MTENEKVRLNKKLKKLLKGPQYLYYYANTNQFQIQFEKTNPKIDAKFHCYYIGKI